MAGGGSRRRAASPGTHGKMLGGRRPPASGRAGYAVTQGAGGLDHRQASALMNGMADRDPTPHPAPSATPKPAATAKKPLSPAAERALAEAAERRARREGSAVSEHPPEHGGRG